LVAHAGRNRFIRNLALSLKGNTLVLFERVEKHGQILQEMIRSKIAPDRKMFYVHGGTDTDDRNQIRYITEGETNAIIVASYGTFSTGISIRNIDNIVFSSPTKSIESVAFVSLGCVKNLVDSERMLGLLAEDGLAITPDAADADAIVINTCGFLEASKTESLQEIRDAVQMKKDGKCKRVVVAGCRLPAYLDLESATPPAADVAPPTAALPPPHVPAPAPPPEP